MCRLAQASLIYRIALSYQHPPSNTKAHSSGSSILEIDIVGLHLMFDIRAFSRIVRRSTCFETRSTMYFPLFNSPNFYSLSRANSLITFLRKCDDFPTPCATFLKSTANMPTSNRLSLREFSTKINYIHIQGEIASFIKIRGFMLPPLPVRPPQKAGTYSNWVFPSVCTHLLNSSRHISCPRARETDL